MTMRSAADVARRCLSLELLAQRSLAEDDGDETARATWSKQIEPLGIGAELSAEERALVDKKAGTLEEDERDDLDGRVAGAAVLLWALGRASSRPNFASAEEVIGEHGLLGDGSITKARASIDAATLRAEEELDTALAAYLKTRGKAKDPDDPEQIYAGIAAHHLTWVLESSMSFEHDIDLD